MHLFNISSSKVPFDLELYFHLNKTLVGEINPPFFTFYMLIDLQIWFYTKTTQFTTPLVSPLLMSLLL